MDMIKKIFLWLWQLPQHLVAWVMLVCIRPKRFEDLKGRRVYVFKGPIKKRLGVSLGDYIFISSTCGEPQIMHEYGHSIQSRIFGPLYLLVIGLPSAVIPFEGKRYFETYPEAWANKLGGVECISTGNLACDYVLRLKTKEANKTL